MLLSVKLNVRTVEADRSQAASGLQIRIISMNNFNREFSKNSIRKHIMHYFQNNIAIWCGVIWTYEVNHNLHMLKLLYFPLVVFVSSAVFHILLFFFFIFC